MAQTTTNLNLTLGEFNEFVNSWDTTLNDNFQKIDLDVGSLQALTANAAGSETTIDDRLTIVEANAVTGAGLGLVGKWLYDTTDTPTTFGPKDTTQGDPAPVRFLHARLKEIYDASGPSDVVYSAAGSLATAMANRMAYNFPQGLEDSRGGAGTLFDKFSNTVLHITGGAGGVIALLGGRHALFRESVIQAASVPSAAIANERVYILATSGVDTSITGTDGAASGNEFTSASISNVPAANILPGDYLEVDSASPLIDGFYLIDQVLPNKVIIKGTLPPSSELAFRIHRLAWPTVSIKRFGPGLDFESHRNFLAYTAAGSQAGALIGHIDLDVSKFIQTENIVEYAFGGVVDEGWEEAATFFDTGVPLSAGAPVTKTLELPDIPAHWQLLWSASSDGSNAQPVPLGNKADDHGVRQYWNRNVLSVIAADAASVLIDPATVATIDLTAFNAGYLRLIAKGA